MKKVVKRKKAKTIIPQQTINLLKGRMVSILTDQFTLIETEEGISEHPLIIDGLFIHFDGDNYYLNTKTNEPNQFNEVVPKLTCKLLTVIADKLPEETPESNTLLN